MASNNRRVITGKIGEEAAVDYLTERGYLIVARNWRCKIGEMDIVASTDQLIVFIEVRTRSTSSRYGTAAESVDLRKQRQVRQTAQVYLKMHPQANSQARFDVIAVQLNKDRRSVERIEHYENAF